MEQEFALCAILYLVLLIGSWFAAASNEKVWKWTMKVVLANQLWLVLLVVVGLGALLPIQAFQDQFLPEEAFIVGLLGLLIAFPLLILIYFHCTGMEDYEIHNGYILYVTHRPGYYTKHKRQVRNSKGEVTGSETYYIYHPEEWYSTDSNGYPDGIDRGIYANYAEYFKYGEYDTSDDVAYDERTQVTTCEKTGVAIYRYTLNWKEDVERVPSSSEHSFSNYVKAAPRSLLRYPGAMQGYEHLLIEYPRVHSGKFGNIYLRRVFDPQKLVDDAWEERITHRLAVRLATAFEKKRANVLVYVVPDMAAYYAVHEKWIGGNFNDVVVVVQATHIEQIEEVKVMCWTDNTAFIANLEHNLRAISWTDADLIANTIVDAIELPDDQNGFKEKSLEAFEYLKYEVRLPWWASMLTIVVIAAWLGPVIYAAANDDLIRLIGTTIETIGEMINNWNN